LSLGDAAKRLLTVTCDACVSASLSQGGMAATDGCWLFGFKKTFVNPTKDRFIF
jgi:hypothetical protein